MNNTKCPRCDKELYKDGVFVIEGNGTRICFDCHKKKAPPEIRMFTIKNGELYE